MRLLCFRIQLQQRMHLYYQRPGSQVHTVMCVDATQAFGTLGRIVLNEGILRDDCNILPSQSLIPDIVNDIPIFLEVQTTT